jgi:hypothetical protein
MNPELLNYIQKFKMDMFDFLHARNIMIQCCFGPARAGSFGRAVVPPAGADPYSSVPKKMLTEGAITKWPFWPFHGD